MARDRIVQQVHGILTINRIKPRASEDDDSLLVQPSIGSAAVIISFHAWGTETMISLSADVLVEVEVDGEQKHKLLESLNDLNAKTRFGKFFFDAGTSSVKIEYDFPGDYLEAEELMTPLLAISQVADEVDDELLHDLGTGRRAADLIARLQEHSSPSN